MVMKERTFHIPEEKLQILEKVANKHDCTDTQALLTAISKLEEELEDEAS
jgi:hypothetical protein